MAKISPLCKTTKYYNKKTLFFQQFLKIRQHNTYTTYLLNSNIGMQATAKNCAKIKLSRAVQQT